MSVHAILWVGKEQRPGKGWNLTACPSKESAVEEAKAFLRRGHIVHAIEADGKAILNEEEIRKEVG
jgi:hypothetical protein